jgi:uncharacterized protein (TIGR02646 family)
LRPVNKLPCQGDFSPWGTAQKPLKEKIGEYCSYCERWIASAIHVEHKKPKNQFDLEKFKWLNFLLACPNCNSSRPKTIGALADTLWPDDDNTFRAFQYDSDGRVSPVITGVAVIDDKIMATWMMFKLNAHPDTTGGRVLPTDKDDRWLHREQTWAKAMRRRNDLAGNDTPVERGKIVEYAIERGMFSVWMTVFSSDIDMKIRLIAAFLGTDLTSFDANGDCVPRPAGQF